MDPKPFILLFALVFIIYLLAKREKPLEFYYRHRKKRTPRQSSDTPHLSHKEYIKKVVEEGNRKEQEGRIKAEERERIKKSISKL